MITGSIVPTDCLIVVDIQIVVLNTFYLRSGRKILIDNPQQTTLPDSVLCTPDISCKGGPEEIAKFKLSSITMLGEDDVNPMHPYPAYSNKTKSGKTLNKIHIYNCSRPSKHISINRTAYMKYLHTVDKYILSI